MNSPLQTDLYQLTMAAGYWHHGQAGREAVFHLFFRRCPFGGGYAVAAGLGPALDWLEDFRFTAPDLEYLSTMRTARDTPLFAEGFLDFLAGMRLDLRIEALPEGTVVFAQEPLLRVQGPILHAQLVETALLNILNFQTLVATKAARICDAAGGAPVIEFGYRRAQGPDGGLSASRAAWLGGCAATSNVEAGRAFGIPVRGTHAHSWVMSFPDEAAAFEAYAEAMPDNCILLVDTYDSLDGVDHAIATARRLRARGHELGGVRLDSGDLAWLSQQARQRLDAAGFPEVRIVASNDLDEHLIESLRHQGARIDVWGVGTNLVTAADQPALGGVYKLSAIRGDDGLWIPKAKRSEQSAKSSIPGRLQVRRYEAGGMFLGDAIFDPDRGIAETPVVVDPTDNRRRKAIPAGATHTDLLVKVMEHGRRVAPPEPLGTARARRAAQTAKLHPTIRRFDHPHTYPAGLESGLAAFRDRLLAETSGHDAPPSAP